MAVKSVLLLLFVLTLWIILPGTVSINVLESNPTLADEVLTACAGEQISLTCTHDITAVNTLWSISPPVNCSASVGHAPPASEPCGPFTFDGITQVVVGVTALESTAMATADVSMTGSVVKCRSGNILMSTFVGNASLCIVAPPSPPTNISCGNTSDGLLISWEAVTDDSCAMSTVQYNLTITQEDDVIYNENVTGVSVEVNNKLQPGQSYNISVSTLTVKGSCNGESAVIMCETSETISPPSTTTPTPSTTSVVVQTSPSPKSQPHVPIIPIVVPIVAVIIVVILTLVVLIIIYWWCGNKNNCKRTDQGIPLSTNEDEHKETAPVYAMVDKTKKEKNAEVELPTYQDPASIQHEPAVSGDLYAVSEKKRQGQEEEVQGAVYSEVDKSKKNENLMYAAVDVQGMRQGSAQGQQPPTGVLYSDIQYP